MNQGRRLKVSLWKMKDAEWQELGSEMWSEVWRGRREQGWKHSSNLLKKHEVIGNEGISSRAQSSEVEEESIWWIGVWGKERQDEGAKDTFPHSEGSGLGCGSSSALLIDTGFLYWDRPPIWAGHRATSEVQGQKRHLPHGSEQLNQP